MGHIKTFIGTPQKEFVDSRLILQKMLQGFLYKETRRTGEKEFRPWDALEIQVFWEKGWKHTPSQTGSKLIFPCGSLPTSVSWVLYFQDYRFTKI